MPETYIFEARDNALAATPLEQNMTVPANTEIAPHNKGLQSTGALMATAGIGLAKKASRDEITRYGERTGNRQKQNEINNAMKIMGMAGSVAQGAFTGFAVGNVPGAVAGALIAGGMEAYGLYRENEDLELQRAKTNYEAEYNRKVYAFSNSNNRNRGND